jgi:hypothetical protein
LDVPYFNQLINVTSVAMKFIENSCQPFTEDHLFGVPDLKQHLQHHIACSGSGATACAFNALLNVGSLEFPCNSKHQLPPAG